MANVEQGSVLDQMTGAVGSIVIVNLNGQKIARCRPPKGINKKGTPLQKLQRASLAAQHAMAKSVKQEIIKRIWSHVSFEGGMNPYNGFIKANSGAFAKCDYVAFPEHMVISQGNLLPVRSLRVIQEGENLKFTWEKGYTGTNSSLKDRLNLFVLSSQRLLRIVEVDARRESCTATIPVPDKQAEFTEGYAFWSSEDDQRFSPSVYWACR
jgi:hypothetical protein